MNLWEASLRLVRRFAADRSGGIALFFGLAFPVVAGTSIAALEYTNISSERAKLQSAADAAALASARELRFANADPTVVERVSDSFARTNLMALTGSSAGNVTASADPGRGTVEVMITRAYVAAIVPGFFAVPETLSARARARVGGGAPLCVIGLEPTAKGAVALDQRAQLTAPNCVVYANSRHNFGLDVKASASMSAQVICSAGGKSGRQAAFNPDPLTNCPQISDPLASRPAPPSSGCMEKDLVISGMDLTLKPGVYCGGLRVTGGARVRLSPGIFVIKDGPLVVEGNASLSGVNTGFYFTGANALLDFKPESSISLTAPRDGVMAGLLLFEDRAATALNLHRVTSNDASVLLGTIYLPNARLLIDAERPVADRSAYTIVVVRRMELEAGPNLVMNTDYASTDVPVPEGVGVVGNTSILIQ